MQSTKTYSRPLKIGNDNSRQTGVTSDRVLAPSSHNCRDKLKNPTKEDLQIIEYSKPETTALNRREKQVPTQSIHVNVRQTKVNIDESVIYTGQPETRHTVSTVIYTTNDCTMTDSFNCHMLKNTVIAVSS